MVSTLPLLAVAGALATPNLVPYPADYRAEADKFVFERKAIVEAPAELDWVAGRLKDDLAPAGWRLQVRRKAAKAAVRLKLDPKLAALGREGYRLKVRTDGVLIEAAQPAGVFYGVQTFRQLLPVEAFGSPAGTAQAWEVACATIEDQPRFGWRGTHLDVARHFMPLPFLRRMVDLLAMHRMNVLHLHLTDDQGWRMEIKRYPKLTSVGAWRKDTQTNDRPDEFTGKPHGGFYTQAELRDLVAYAKARNVEIMPEIEMPGHSQAAIAAYPELGNTGKPLEVATGWGVHVDVLNVEDSTIRFYQNVLDEVMAVFPFQFVHIGGDEAPKRQWKESPRAQARMKELGLKDEDELQSWFIRQMDVYLASKGRRLVGWDEILEGGLAPGATVMSWRGEAGGIAAAKAGHDVIMSPAAWAYLDQAQTLDPRLELSRSWGYLSLERIYRYEPIPAELPAEAAPRVLGAQTALWTEVIPDPGTAEWQLFPRMSAMAEVLWSPRVNRDYADFHRRITAHVERLDRMGVRRKPVDPLPWPRAGGWTVGELSTEFEAREWSLDGIVKGPGAYEVLVEYFGGDHGAAIESVSLLVDGEVVSTDSHPGQTGAVHRDNVYRVTLERSRRGAKIAVRVVMRGDGGTDSQGDVRVFKAK